MSLESIDLRRLWSQRITARKLDRVDEVVRWMGAIQAQDYGQAVWAVAVRTPSATLAEVEQAIEEAKIIRTLPMRGTIHFIPPEDAHWMLSLSAWRTLKSAKKRHADLGLDEDTFRRSQALFIDALKGRKRLSRPDMIQLLEDNGISTAGQRGYHILGQAAHEGVLCIGPMEGKQQTFVLLNEWVKKSKTLTPDEALTEISRRYVASHGPVTAPDLARWASITLTESRQGFDSIRDECLTEIHDGEEYWFSPELPQSVEPDDEVYLLPGYDEYFLGYKDRAFLIEDAHANKVVPGNNGVFYPMIVMDGQVVGTWKRHIKKKGVELTLTPFASIPDLRRRADRALCAYADFLELPILSVTETP